MRQVINFIRDGKADVGIVRTCFIEELGEMGWNLSGIKVIGDKTIAGRSFHCKNLHGSLSGLDDFATPRLNPEEARKVVLTLLSLPERKKESLIGASYRTSAQQTIYIKNLKLGPYSYLRNWTWKKFWDEYGIYVSLLMLTGVGIFGHSLRESYLVKKELINSEDHYKEEEKLRKKPEVPSSNFKNFKSRSGGTNIINHRA